MLFRGSEDHHSSSWDDSDLRRRFQRALSSSSFDPPPGIATKAMARARQEHRQRLRGTSWMAVTGLISAASFLVFILHSGGIGGQPEPIAMNVPPYSHRHAVASRQVPATVKPAVPDVVKESRSVPQPSKSIAERAVAHWVETGNSRRSMSSQSDVRNRIAQLKSEQARDFELAAGVLEEAGQAEPAFQLYSMSMETSPSLDATLGIARVVGQMDRDMMMNSTEDPAGTHSPDPDLSSTG